jgi:hypothetical protein
MKTFLWCFCLLTGLSMHGQQKAIKPKIEYKQSLIISPFVLLDVDQTILIGSEYRFKEQWAVVTDAGYTFSSYYISNTKHTSGFTIRPAIRKYYGKRNELYWQAQLLYKYVTYTQNDWLGKDCVQEVPTYEQYQEFKFRKKVYGLNIMTGEIMPLSQKLFFEIYAGFGVRFKRHLVVNEPNSCYRTNSVNGPISYDAKSTTLSLPISMRLFYKLR